MDSNNYGQLESRDEFLKTEQNITIIARESFPTDNWENFVNNNSLSTTQTNKNVKNKNYD